MIDQLHVVVAAKLRVHAQLLNTVRVPVAAVAAKLYGVIVVIGASCSGSHVR